MRLRMSLSMIQMDSSQGQLLRSRRRKVELKWKENKVEIQGGGKVGFKLIKKINFLFTIICNIHVVG